MVKRDGTPDSLRKLVEFVLRENIFDVTAKTSEEVLQHHELYSSARTGAANKAPDPHSAYDSLVNARDPLVLVFGQAGCGKSTFLLYHWLVREGCKLASSGIIVSTPGFSGTLSSINWLIYLDFKRFRGADQLRPMWVECWRQLRILAEEQYGVGFFSELDNYVFAEALRDAGAFNEYNDYMNCGEAARAKDLIRPYLQDPEHCVRAVLAWISRKPAKEHPKICFLFDNADLDDDNLEMRIFHAVQIFAFGVNGDEAQFRCVGNITLALRQETYDRIASLGVDYDTSFIDLPSPSEAPLLKLRGDAIARWIQTCRIALDAALMVPSPRRQNYRVWQLLPVSATAELFSSLLIDSFEGIPFFRVDDRELLSDICRGSTRRLLQSWKNILLSRGIHADAIVSCFLASEMGEMVGGSVDLLSSYSVIDALICGSERRYKERGNGVKVVVNLFDLPTAGSAVWLLALPTALQVVLRLGMGVNSRLREDEFRSEMVSLGFCESVAQNAFKRLVRDQFLLRVSASSLDGQFVVATSYAEAHLRLLGHAAYIDNMAQSTDACYSVPRATAGWDDADFPQRVNNTIRFLQSIMQAERELVNPGQVNSRWHTLSFWSPWKRAVAGYRERLAGLLAANRVPGNMEVVRLSDILGRPELSPLGADEWRTRFMEPGHFRWCQELRSSSPLFPR